MRTIQELVDVTSGVGRRGCLLEPKDRDRLTREADLIMGLMQVLEADLGVLRENHEIVCRLLINDQMRAIDDLEVVSGGRRKGFP